MLDKLWPSTYNCSLKYSHIKKKHLALVSQPICRLSYSNTCLWPSCFSSLSHNICGLLPTLAFIKYIHRKINRLEHNVDIKLNHFFFIIIIKLFVFLFCVCLISFYPGWSHTEDDDKLSLSHTHTHTLYSFISIKFVIYIKLWFILFFYT